MSWLWLTPGCRRTGRTRPLSGRRFRGGPTPLGSDEGGSGQPGELNAAYEDFNLRGRSQAREVGAPTRASPARCSGRPPSAVPGALGSASRRSSTCFGSGSRADATRTRTRGRHTSTPARAPRAGTVIPGRLPFRPGHASPRWGLPDVAAASGLPPPHAAWTRALGQATRATGPFSIDEAGDDDQVCSELPAWRRCDSRGRRRRGGKAFAENSETNNL